MEPSDRRTWAVAAALVVGSVVWQSTFPFLLGIDAFYHLAQARSILHEGLDAGMPWMRYSIFEDGWVDHHLGFHVALVPFLAWPGGILGGKLAAGVLGGAAAAAVLLWLRASRAPHPALLTLAMLAASWGFTYRIGMVRAMSLSVILLVLTLYAAIRGRNRLLFVTSAVYALSYHLSVLVLPIAVGAWLARRLWGDDDDGPTAWTAAAAAAGFALGMSIHPHAPATWSFLIDHVVIGMDVTGVPLPVEWNAATASDTWMQGFGWAGALVVAGPWLLRRAHAQGTLRWETILVAAGAAVSVALSVKAVRFVELSMPLVTLAAGLVLRDVGFRLGRRQHAVVGLVLGVALLATLERTQRNGDTDPERFAPAAQWLADHVEPGTVIYNFHWSEWPELVLHAPEYQYIFGLAPSIIAERYPEKWRHFEAIRSGEYANPGAAIRHEFDADYVIFGPNPAATRMFSEAPGTQFEVGNDDFSIYRVTAAP